MAKIKKGDRVIVLTGKDRGREGVVSAVHPKKGTCLVDGVNLATKHQKPKSETEPGGILEVIMPLPLSNVAVISPGDGKATRVGFKINDDGTKVRVCKRTGAEIK